MSYICLLMVLSSCILQVAAQVQGVKTNLVQTYNLHLCKSATIKNARFSKSGGTGTEEKKKIIKIQKVSTPMPETTNLKLGTKIVQLNRPGFFGTFVLFFCLCNFEYVWFIYWTPKIHKYTTN